jgi:uncharacterized membrane protein
MIGGMGGCCGYGWFDGFGAFWWTGYLFFVIISLGLIAGMAAIISRAMQSSDRTTAFTYTRDALYTVSLQDIVAVWYARGDIDRDEFMRIVSDLG